MTPKEKAKELVFNYYNLGLSYSKAKKCALIAVENLIKYSPFMENYWQEVKQEIKKL